MYMINIVCSFMLKKPYFLIKPSGIAREGLICAYYSVAGNNNGNFVMPHRAANGLRRHMIAPHLHRKAAGKLAVGSCLPIGDIQEQLPHSLAKA